MAETKGARTRARIVAAGTALVSLLQDPAVPGGCPLTLPPIPLMPPTHTHRYADVAATVLDSAMGCAVHTELPAGAGYTTVDLQVRYLRAATVATGPMRAEATVVHRGARMATAEGRLVDGHGRLVATATTSCLLIGPTAAPGPGPGTVPGAARER